MLMAGEFCYAFPAAGIAGAHDDKPPQCDVHNTVGVGAPLGIPPHLTHRRSRLEGQACNKLNGQQSATSHGAGGHV